MDGRGRMARYSVNVATAGTYTLEARVASSGLGGTFHVEANDVNVSGTMSVPDTGGWQAWQTITKPVTLTAGTQSIRVVLDTTGQSGAVCNLNFVRFIAAGGTAPAAPTNLTATAVSIDSNQSRVDGQRVERNGVRDRAVARWDGVRAAGDGRSERDDVSEHGADGVDDVSLSSARDEWHWAVGLVECRERADDRHRPRRRPPALADDRRCRVLRSISREQATP